MRRLDFSFLTLFGVALLLATVFARGSAIGQTPQPKPTMSLTPMPIVTVAPTTQPSVPPGGALVTVPGGTEVDVAVTEPISSSSATVGDTFAFKALSDVTVNGWIIIAKGSPGQGEVISVDRAGSHGHPGSLGLQMDWIFAADGEKVLLTNQRTTQEGENKAGASSTATILSYIFLGPVGLFAHNFVKGRDIIVDSSHPFEEYFADTVHVVATAKENNSGFAH